MLGFGRLIMRVSVSMSMSISTRIGLAASPPHLYTNDYSPRQPGINVRFRIAIQSSSAPLIHLKMVWPWSSTPSESATPPTQNPSIPAPPQSTPNPPSQPPNSTLPLTRDELADRELQSFLSELSASSSEAPKPPSKPRYQRGITKSSTSQTASPSSQTSPTNNESLAESLLPTTMSCRSAFDAAFYCQSMGGKFNDLYRYGTLKSCSPHWNDFWFCMRTRTFSSPQKEAAIRDHYRQKEEAKYGPEETRGKGGLIMKGTGKGADGEGEERVVFESSEDIWKSRDRKVEWGTAFVWPEEEEKVVDDEEYRRKLGEWRQKEAGMASKTET